MKKNYLFLTICAIIGSLLAQPLQAQVRMKSISAGASYWKPSLNYWNERSTLLDFNLGKGATFSGAIMPTVAAEVGLTKGLSVGGRVGYWANTVSGDVKIGTTTRSEKLNLSIIPVALDLKYTFAANADSSASDGKSPFLTPYIGVSVARYFIKNDFSRQVVGGTGSVSEAQAGNSYGVQVFVGAEKQLVKKLYLALDVRYHLGNYNQVVKTEVTSSVEKVSLAGLEAGLSLRFKFN